MVARSEACQGRPTKAGLTWDLTVAGGHDFYVAVAGASVLVPNGNSGGLPSSEEARFMVMEQAAIPLDTPPIEELPNGTPPSAVTGVGS
jgi:hypothetical protein